MAAVTTRQVSPAIFAQCDTRPFSPVCHTFHGFAHLSHFPCCRFVIASFAQFDEQEAADDDTADADLETIAEVVEALRPMGVPVLSNGNVRTPEDIVANLKSTGVCSALARADLVSCRPAASLCRPSASSCRRAAALGRRVLSSKCLISLALCPLSLSRPTPLAARFSRQRSRQFTRQFTRQFSLQVRREFRWASPR